MLIGIMGKKQVGKDTVASILKYLFWLKSRGVDINNISQDYIKHCASDVKNNRCIGDVNVEIRPIAYTLKRCVAAILDCDESLLYKEKFKASSLSYEKCSTVRELLQKVGTEVGRQIDKNIWINSLTDYYKNKFTGECLVVPDVRFANEVEELRKIDPKCLIIFVTRDTGFKDKHISETSMDGFDKADVYIENNGTLEELVRKVKFLI